MEQCASAGKDVDTNGTGNPTIIVVGIVRQTKKDTIPIAQRGTHKHQLDLIVARGQTEKYVRASRVEHALDTMENTKHLTELAVGPVVKVLTRGSPTPTGQASTHPNAKRGTRVVMGTQRASSPILPTHWHRSISECF